MRRAHALACSYRRGWSETLPEPVLEFAPRSEEFVTRMRSILGLVLLVLLSSLTGCASPRRVLAEFEGEELRVILFQGDPVERAPGAGLDAPAWTPGVRLTRGEGVSRVRVLQRSDTAVHVAWQFVGPPDAEGARELRPLGSLELEVRDDGLAVRTKGTDTWMIGSNAVGSFELKDDGTVVEQP